MPHYLVGKFRILNSQKSETAASEALRAFLLSLQTSRFRIKNPIFLAFFSHTSLKPEICIIIRVNHMLVSFNIEDKINVKHNKRGLHAPERGHTMAGQPRSILCRS